MDNRDAGAFILVDEHTNDTVAAGIVEGARGIADRGESVAWTPSALPADDRAARTGQRGAVLLLVNPDGVAASAAGIEDALTARGRNAYALDGAALRSALDLSPDARSAAIHLARVARLLADAGVVAVLALDAADPAVLAAVHQEIDAAGVERHLSLIHI